MLYMYYIQTTDSTVFFHVVHTLMKHVLPGRQIVQPTSATTSIQTTDSTANPTWGDIFECGFKAQSSKLQRLFCHVSVKRNVRTLSFEL